MKIDPTGVPRPPLVRRDRPVAPGRFQASSAGEFAPSSTQGLGLLGGVEGLFALQEVADPLERRRRGVRYGHQLLDRLERLQAGLLTGKVDTAELAQLASGAAAQREKTDDPVLEDVLGQIELRVAVEIAKRQR